MANVLVTGSSKGFGYLIVKTLLKAGHKVAASMRAPGGSNKTSAGDLKSAGAVIVEMDVTSDSSVTAGVAEAIKSLGGLDIVVNNAGVGVNGWQETFDIDDFRKLFEVNVFGVQRVNRAVIPHMRGKRSGLLMHVSSILGRVVIPFYGPYNASKFALEALADNYKIELSRFGIESVLIEPGGYATEFGAALIRPSDKQRLKEYGELAGLPDMAMKAFEERLKGPNAPDPQWVADAVLEVINAPRGKRPFRTPVDRMGMGTAVEPFNRAAEQMQAGLYQAMGLGDTLTLKM